MSRRHADEAPIRVSKIDVHPSIHQYKSMKWLTFLVMIGLLHAEPEQRVQEVRGWYQKIEESTAIKQLEVKFEAENDPLFGNLTVREYADGLSAVTLSYVAGAHGGTDEYFYFKDGELFFVFEVDQSWRFSGGADASGEHAATIDTRIENRYYYDAGKCIRRLSRSAKAADAMKLPAMIAKVNSKQVEPGESASVLLKRAPMLLAAKNAKDVLASFGLED